MIFLPTTHFKVLKPTLEFPLDFQVTHRADYIVVLANSNNETYSISPLVIEHRLRQGRIAVIAFPVHPSHTLDVKGREAGLPDQCRQCCLQSNEEQIQFECPLPAREILGPESFGGSDEGSHLMSQTRASELRLHLDERPIVKMVVGPERGTDTICPACVLGDPRLRLCVTHLNCPTCGNPRVFLCPTCLEPKA